LRTECSGKYLDLREEGIIDWSELSKEEIKNLCSTPYITKMIKSRRMFGRMGI